ncbi:Snf7-domain-containing protein [Astrocystis sublimbata]|nr:Snf7-domain-containing protein [Astrocystis sublimbata]
MSELLDYLLQTDPNFRKARLPSLYSDFRPQRTLNPDGFAANVSAWKRGLSAAVLAGHSNHQHHVILCVDDALLRSLESKQFGRPLALGSALQDAMAEGQMLPLAQFRKATQSIVHAPSSWGSVSWAVAGWALRQVGLGGHPGDALPKDQLVLMQNLEILANAFASATTAVDPSPFERIYSAAHFRRTFEGRLLEGAGGAKQGGEIKQERKTEGAQTQTQKLSDTDLEVLITYLSRDKGLIATDGNTIRIRDSSETSETSAITQEDSAIASLKELISSLTQQTSALSRRVDELSIAALDAVQRKNRVSALAALKSKKQAEANLATRHTTLAQLEEVANKIQQASDNVALVKVMASSTGVLRSLNAQVGGADRVDAVLDDLREQMGEVDEVGNVIAEVGGGVVAEEEVDDEFEAMLAEEQRKEEEAERVRNEAREAEETRRKLAELERLGPTPGAVKMGEGEGREGEKRAETPATETANVLSGMHLEAAN